MTDEEKEIAIARAIMLGWATEAPFIWTHKLSKKLNYGNHFTIKRLFWYTDRYKVFAVTERERGYLEDYAKYVNQDEFLVILGYREDDENKYYCFPIPECKIEHRTSTGKEIEVINELLAKL